MEKNITIVVGSNYGDEGKGRTTDFYSNSNTVVVRTNGGAQASHTVNNGEERHAFSHFGSGTMKNAATYLSEFFIINPILFAKEHKKLLEIGLKPKVFVNEKCIVSGYIDMVINQITEIALGDNKFGSCGLGIYETVERNKTEFSYNIKEMLEDLENGSFYERIKNIIYNYAPSRISDMTHGNQYPAYYNEILMDAVTYNNYCSDIFYMLKNVVIVKNDNEVFDKYTNIIFECSQGLMLDMDRESDGENVTPSHTGIQNPIKIIKSNALDNNNINVVYCTRWYLTRHGVGRLEYECDKMNLSDSIKDLTNIPNPFQGTLRFAPLNIDKFVKRISKDLKFADIDKYHVSVSVCCLDSYVDDYSLYINNNEAKVGKITNFIYDLKNKLTESIIDFGVVLCGYGEDSKETIAI